jgi:LysR family glycine cleavage system transcriptional activator
VALGRSVLVADDLAAGRLVKPFDLQLPTQSAYYVVYSENAGDRPKIRAFREWLHAEVARDRRPNAELGRLLGAIQEEVRQAPGTV